MSWPPSHFFVIFFVTFNFQGFRPLWDLLLLFLPEFTHSMRQNVVDWSFFSVAFLLSFGATALKSFSFTSTWGTQHGCDNDTFRAAFSASGCIGTPKPCPSFPCFFGIPCFFPLRGFPCFFWAFFAVFSRDFRGSVGIRNPCFFWWFSSPFSKKTRKGRTGRSTAKQGKTHKRDITPHSHSHTHTCEAPPLTMVAAAPQNAHWKNQDRALPSQTASSHRAIPDPPTLGFLREEKKKAREIPTETRLLIFAEHLKLGNGRNTVSRVLFPRRELTEPHWVLR